MNGYLYDSWRKYSQPAAARDHAPKISAAKRSALLGCAFITAFAGLGVRAAYWQITQHSYLTAQANAEHMLSLQIPSLRGQILDTHGVILALTMTGSSIIADPLQLQQLNTQNNGVMQSVAQNLAQITGVAANILLPQLQLQTQYHMLTNANGQTIYAAGPEDDALQTAINNGSLPGVTTQSAEWRVYPSDGLAAQLIGFVQNGANQGKYGIESSWQTALAGTNGLVYTPVDVNGQPLAGSHEITAPIPGANISLTIDANIQFMAEQGLQNAVTAMNADAGTVIVEDPSTGAIVAMANYPSFDPNTYSSANISSFTNPAVSSMYDPGSTMKAFTMATALDLGAITPDTSFNDPGYINAGGQIIYNWNQLAWGTETMTQVLEHSANVGASWVALNKIGQQNFYNYLSAFGFGSQTGIALPDEAAGQFPQSQNAAQAELNLAENSFGESIGVTPLQMVMGYGALANGGLLMKPMIVQSVQQNGKNYQYKPVTVRRVISAQAAQQITQMLIPTGIYGDAQTYLIQGYAVAAKTGTSTPNPQDPSWTYASVIGYAPANHPKYVILVKLDHPQTNIFGGFAAGPLWRQLVRELMAYANIPPSN